MYNSLDVVKCLNCKYCTHKNIKKDAKLYECSLKKDVFDLDKNELYCNKKCYKKRALRKS